MAADHRHAPMASQAMFLSYPVKGQRMGTGRCATCGANIECFEGDPTWYAAGERLQLPLDNPRGSA